MALDASEILGSPQLAGVKVNRQGTTKKAYVGAVGTAIIDKANERKGNVAPESQTPDFGRLAWLAVTPDEVALIGFKGLVTGKLNDVIARVPRSEVASAEVGGASIMISPPLKIQFTSGESWDFEVPRPSRNDAVAVAGVLAGRAAGARDGG
jgi:hypothetical protein